MRTGQYKSINCIPIHEGELEKRNPLIEEIEIDFEKAQVEKHKKKFSKSDVGWKNDCDAMAPKFPSLQAKKIQKTKRARSRSFDGKPVQASTFIRMVQDTPTILRVALTKDQKSVPSISTANLSTKEVIAEVNITSDTLENNIEQEVAYRCDFYQFLINRK